MICLDTSAVIAILNDRPVGVRPKFDASRAAETAFVLSAIVVSRMNRRSPCSPIGPYDVLIAAQARRLGATMVTANGREFDRFLS